MKVLQVSPHPDDELIGAPATLMALRDAGCEVTNYAVSTGRPGDTRRRSAELTEACRRAGFELILPESLPISGGDDLAAAEGVLAARLGVLVGAYDVVFSPSPHDRHHGHEVVARATRRALEGAPKPPRWWMWGFWGDLPLPNVLCSFGEERMQEILYCLSAHAGELARNDYGDAVRGRALANSALGPERVFGFGSHGRAAASDRYAELCCEAVRTHGCWQLGAARTLTPGDPVSAAPTDTVVDFWLDNESVTTHLRAQQQRS